MDRREALAALMALPATARISRAAVKPDDVIVIECDEVLSVDVARRITQQGEQIWPGHRVAVLGKGMHLRIASESERR